MAYGFAARTFTPSVRAAQAKRASPLAGRDFQHMDRDYDRFGPAEATFIAARDSLYMASAGETGWPYVQHRGGPAGFIRVLDETTLAFPDFRGNRQHISLGNLTANDKVALILMDYPNRRRLKILGHARVVEAADDPELMQRLALPGYPEEGSGPRIEGAFVITLAAFDWNCPQHIVPRFTIAEVADGVAALQARIAELEAELAAAKGGQGARQA